MENLIFSLNATVPIFLMMVLGMVFRKIGWMDVEFAEKMNKFVFLVPLPVLLFSDLATVDFEEVWNIRFVIFCFIVTFISIAIVERQDYSGRVYPVILSEQCGTAGNCIYSEYLWKCRNGSADDHWKCPTL